MIAFAGNVKPVTKTAVNNLRLRNVNNTAPVVQTGAKEGIMLLLATLFYACLIAGILLPAGALYHAIRQMQEDIDHE